jgi:hypothetical protein
MTRLWCLQARIFLNEATRSKIVESIAEEKKPFSIEELHFSIQAKDRANFPLLSSLNDNSEIFNIRLLCRPLSKRKDLRQPVESTEDVRGPDVEDLKNDPSHMANMELADNKEIDEFEFSLDCAGPLLPMELTQEFNMECLNPHIEEQLRFQLQEQKEDNILLSSEMLRELRLLYHKCANHFPQIAHVDFPTNVELQTFYETVLKEDVKYRIRNELKRNETYFNSHLATASFSEMLLDCLIGYPTVDCGIMEALLFLVVKFGLVHNKNFEWACHHLLQAEGDPCKYHSRPDSGLYLRTELTGFNPLVLTAEYKRKYIENDYINDWTKLAFQLIFSGHMIYILNRISTKPISKRNVSLYGWLIPGAHNKDNVWNSLVIELYKLEFDLDESDAFNPQFKATYSLVKAFPIREFEQVVVLSYLITLNGSKIAEMIDGLKPHTHFKTLIENHITQVGKCSSIRSERHVSSKSRSQKSSKQKDSSSAPVNSRSNASLLIAMNVLENVRQRFCHTLTDDGIERHPLGDLVFNAVLPDDKTRVVVKIVCTSEADYIKSLSEKVGEVCDARTSGFLFPLKYIHLREDTIALVMEEVKPLSFWDILRKDEMMNMYTQLMNIVKRLNVLEVIHGDLKLSNIGMTNDGLMVLFDWEEGVRGTRGYMAPELREDGTPSHLSDLYSAGIVLTKLYAITKESIPEVVQVISLLTSQDPSVRPSALGSAQHQE